MTKDDLQFLYKGDSYEIYINDSSELSAYKNKLSLTAFFKHVKEDLSNNGTPYNGVIMYNEGNTEYWLSYYSNLNLPNNTVASINDPIDLGTTVFYEVIV